MQVRRQSTRLQKAKDAWIVNDSFEKKATEDIKDDSLAVEKKKKRRRRTRKSVGSANENSTIEKKGSREPKSTEKVNTEEERAKPENANVLEKEDDLKTKNSTGRKRPRRKKRVTTDSPVVYRSVVTVCKDLLDSTYEKTAQFCADFIGHLLGLEERPPFACLVDQHGLRYLGLPEDALKQLLSEYSKMNVDKAFEAPVGAWHRIEARVEGKKVEKKIRKMSRANLKLLQPKPSYIYEFHQLLPSLLHLICFDVEAFEFNNRQLLEVGISRLVIQTGEVITEHFSISEHSHRHNRKHVQSNREGFAFGQSQWTSQRHALRHLEALISQPHTALLGHHLSSDISFVTQCQGHHLPTALFKTIPHFDTQLVFQEYQRIPDRLSLARILNHLQIPHVDLHNAGNDAHYTLQAFMQMTGYQQWHDKNCDQGATTASRLTPMKRRMQ